MRGYALVSVRDADPWGSLEAAQQHISTVGDISRGSAKFHHTAHNRILDAEMQVRFGWARIAHNDTRYSPADIIEIVSQRRSIWPITMDLMGTSNWKTGINRAINAYAPSSSSWQTATWQKKGNGEGAVGFW